MIPLTPAPADPPRTSRRPRVRFQRPQPAEAGRSGGLVSRGVAVAVALGLVAGTGKLGKIAGQEHRQEQALRSQTASGPTTPFTSRRGTGTTRPWVPTASNAQAATDAASPSAVARPGVTSDPAEWRPAFTGAPEQGQPAGLFVLPAPGGSGVPEATADRSSGPASAAGPEAPVDQQNGFSSRLGVGSFPVAGSGSTPGGSPVSPSIPAAGVSSLAAVTSATALAPSAPAPVVSHVTAFRTAAVPHAGPVPYDAGQNLIVNATPATPLGSTNDVQGGANYGVSASQTFNNVYVGYNASGAISQSAGTFAATNQLLIGGDAPDGSPSTGNGVYNLSAGTVTVGVQGVPGSQFGIGVSSPGTFNQNGGTVDATNSGSGLQIGGGAQGTYNLSGGLLTANLVFIGGASGVFNQSGGTFTTNGNALSVATNQGNAATYSLSAGTLSTGTLQVGNSGTGTFTQTGGTVAATGGLNLGISSTANGTYNLDAGTLNVTQVTKGAGTGTFNFDGGTLQASRSDNPGGASNPSTFLVGLSAVNVRGSTTANSGAVIDTNGFNVTIAQPLAHSTVSGDSATDGGLTKLGAGTLTLTGVDTYTGNTTVSAGTLAVSSGGSLTSTLAVSVDSGGTLSLGGTGSITTGQSLNIGRTGAGALVQTGGTLNEGNQFLLGFYSGNGSYNLSGTGSVNMGSAIIGNDGTGSVTQSGGTLNDSGNLYLGEGSNGSGTYTLSGGSASNPYLVIGYSGQGAMTQTGGTFNNGQVVLGFNAGSSGTYTLSGASSVLSTGNVFVGNQGTGRFTQSGGLFTTNGNNLMVGSSLYGRGTFVLSGGTLSTGSAFVGAGGPATFTQSGGTFTTNAAELVLGELANGQATYTLSGGSLATGTAYVGDNGSGTFTQGGGTFNLGGQPLSLAFYSGSSGTYSLNGGTLTAGAVGAGTGTSTFNFNGGTLQAGADSAAFLGGLTTADVQANGAVIDTNGHSVTVAQNLVHDPANTTGTDGGLTKNGAGTLIFTGSNTYLGSTTINAGTFLANNAAGSATGTGNVSVFNATVGGTGTIGGNLLAENGAVVSPGINGPGILHVGGHLALDSGSVLVLELGGRTAGTGYDQIDLGEAVTLNGGNLKVGVTNGFSLAVGQRFFIIDTNGTPFAPGTFGNAPLGMYTDAAGDTFAVDYLDRDPVNGDLLLNDVSLTVLTVAVPEPGTWAWLGVGVGAGVLGMARRRRGRLA